MQSMLPSAINSISERKIMSSITNKLKTVNKRSILPVLYACAFTLSFQLSILQTAEANEAKTITVGVEGEPTQLDPHTHVLWLTYRVVYHLFESFVQPDLTTDENDVVNIVPALAESWKISDDGTTYTFHLRQGVSFHDGTPWNAEAAKFNFDRLLDPDSQFYNNFAGAILNAWWTGDVASYRVVDEYTFEVSLKSPVSNFLQRLANGGYGSAGMVSPVALAQHGDEGFGNNPVGTGPFRFKERIFGEKIVLEKNSDYWDTNRMPKYDQLIFRPIADDAARELALVSGAADIIATPSPDSFSYLEEKGFNVVLRDGPNLQLIWLNMQDPKLQDMRVRKAIYMAIDREGICSQLRLGECEPAWGILNNRGLGYDPQFKPYPYDPDGARALLAEAGVAGNLQLRFDWSTGGAGAVGMESFVQWIQRDLKKVGIGVELVKWDVGTYFNQMLSGMKEGTSLMTIEWGEPSFIWVEFVVMTNGGYNTGKYSNPEIDALMQTVKSSLSVEEQINGLRRVQEIVGNDVPWVPVFSPKLKYATSPKIQGFVLAPEHWQDFAILEISE